MVGMLEGLAGSAAYRVERVVGHVELDVHLVGEALGESAEQRAAARAFVDRFCQPGKPSVTGMVSFRRTTPAFNDEVYEYSRKKYLAE
jgi:hypothetical protein